MLDIFASIPILSLLQQLSMMLTWRWTHSRSSSPAIWWISTPGPRARYRNLRPRLNTRCRNLMPNFRKQSLSLVGGLLNFKVLHQSICFCFSHFASRLGSASHLSNSMLLQHPQLRNTWHRLHQPLQLSAIFYQHHPVYSLATLVSIVPLPIPLLASPSWDLQDRIGIVPRYKVD